MPSSASNHAIDYSDYLRNLDECVAALDRVVRQAPDRRTTDLRRASSFVRRTAVDRERAGYARSRNDA